MAFDPDFLELMESRVVIRRTGVSDKWGNDTHLDTPWQCHVDTSSESVGVTTGDGTVLYRRVQRTTLIGAYLTPVPSAGDQILFAHGDKAVLGKADTVIVDNDEDGPHHITITLTQA